MKLVALSMVKNEECWIPVKDLGSVTLPGHVRAPAVLFRPDGPSNPTLEMWGLRQRKTAVPCQARMGNT